MFTYTWSVQWKSRSTGNIISSDGGPYRVKANAEISMENCLQSLFGRDDVNLLFYAVDIHDVEDGETTIEDVRGDSVPRFEILKSNVERRRERGL